GWRGAGRRRERRAVGSGHDVCGADPALGTRQSPGPDPPGRTGGHRGRALVTLVATPPLRLARLGPSVGPALGPSVGPALGPPLGLPLGPPVGRPVARGRRPPCRRRRP